MNEHEQGFLTFLTERSRRRVATLLELGPKRRADLREAMSHVEFDARWRHHITGSSSSFGSMVRTLQSKGAPSQCFVLSQDAQLDGKELSLDDAIVAASGAFEGTFISCIPGKLGLYEGPGIKSAYLLSK